MPRYKFQWDQVSALVLTTFAVEYGLPLRAVPTELRSRYGARPKEEFVRQNWVPLLDSWLSRDTGARNELVTRLWRLGVGFASEFPKRKTAELEYLRSCRNARRLREEVLEILIRQGEEPPTEKPSLPASKISTSRKRKSREVAPAGRAAEKDSPSYSPTSEKTESSEPVRWLEIQPLVSPRAQSLRTLRDPKDQKPVEAVLQRYEVTRPSTTGQKSRAITWILTNGKSRQQVYPSWNNPDRLVGRWLKWDRHRKPDGSIWVTPAEPHPAKLLALQPHGRFPKGITSDRVATVKTAAKARSRNAVAEA